MTSRAGQRIVTLHPGLDLSLQDALLSAIEGVLHDAGIERQWIESSPEHDLRVYGELPAPVEVADVIPLDVAGPVDVGRSGATPEMA